jgi:protein-L-isoaspartate O-methyltransferase
MYQEYIGIHYIREAQMYDCGENQSILHIGSGAYPITAIALAKMFKGHIVTIDKNPIVLNIAKRVIKKENLTKYVEVLLGNGLTVEVSSFDVIIISSCSVPKEEILTHIFSKMKDHCKIIVRELDSELERLRRYISQNKDIVLIDELRCCSVLNFRWTSLFFQRIREQDSHNK